VNATLLGTVGVDLTEEEWLYARLAGIGGSEAAAIAGVSAWSSPMSVYLSKLGLAEPLAESDAMYWGKALEDPVIARFEDDNGVDVIGRQEFYRSAEHPFMLATIDGRYATTEGDTDTWHLYEGKTTSAWNAKAWKDDVPLAYWVQAQHNLAVTGYQDCAVAVLIGGQRYESAVVGRDDVYIAQLIELESDFYHNHLVPQVPPAIDGSKASEDALKVLFPEDDGTELTTDDPDAEDAIRRYLDYKQAVSEFEAKKRKAANEIKALLGMAERATIGGKYRATWKTIERAAYSVEASSYRKLDVREMEVE